MRTFVFLPCLLLAVPSYAQTHGSDIELAIEAGKIVTDERVYAAELGETIPNEVDEPGFDSPPGTFPAGTSVGFSIVDSLRLWDGSDFETIPAETMSVRFGSALGPVTTPIVPGIVDGFSLNVAADGSWHRHFDFVLGSPAASGIYLLAMQLHSSDPGIGASEPFYIVFNQNDTELVHDAAIGYMLATTAAVPEPGYRAITIVAVLGVVLARGVTACYRSSIGTNFRGVSPV
jgi:hypothetical protein